MKHILIFFVRAYQVTLSPLFTGCCRFEPSCSNYAIEALKVHGAVKGTLLTIKRLLRCRPFGDYGYDPVPPRGQWKNQFGRVGSPSRPHGDDPRTARSAVPARELNDL